MNDETPQISKGQFLNVWRGTDHVGQLIREDEAIQQLSFIYSKDWLSAPDNFPLSIHGFTTFSPREPPCKQSPIF